MSRQCFFADFQDDVKCRVGVLEQELEEMTGKQECTQARLTQLQNGFQEYQEGHCSSSLTISKPNMNHLLCASCVCLQVSEAWKNV